MSQDNNPIQVLRNDNENARRALAEFSAYIKKISQNLSPEEKEKAIDGLKRAAIPLERYVDVQFKVEEDGLFPALGNYIGMETGPIHVMIIEHDNSRQLMENFKKALAAGDQKAIVSDGSSFAALLSEHVEKEDHILLAMADMHLSDGEKKTVLEKINAINAEAGS